MEYDYTAIVWLEGPPNIIANHTILNSLAAELAESGPLIGKTGDTYTVTYALDADDEAQAKERAVTIIEKALGKIGSDWLKPVRVKVTDLATMRDLMGDPQPEVIQLFPQRE